MSISTFIQVDMILENSDEHEQRGFNLRLCYLCVVFLFFLFLNRILKEQYILGYNCSCSNSPKEKERNIQ